MTCSYAPYLAQFNSNGSIKFEGIGDLFIKIETENKKQCFPIYNQRLAGWLMTRGYVLVDMKPNQKYTGRNVFYFVNSVALKNSVDEYFHRT
jgi:hypothetical protein